jgi:predicted aldo/keto reductase-like oxidoreductase
MAARIRHDQVTMEYRELPRGLGTVSVVGLGAGNLYQASDHEVDSIINLALDHGINMMDTVMYDDSAAEPVGRALKGRRDRMIMQIHLGAVYPDGVYTRARSLPEVRSGFENELRKYGTDHADIGIIHYVDDDDDFERIMAPGGIFDYAERMKRDGAIRLLGFSSHAPGICRRFIDTGKVDMFMMSINPSYDFEPRQGKMALSRERQDLYLECQKRGIGITVMKPFGGGQLLSAARSPLRVAMTIPQCLQYALDRPAVLSCLPGAGSAAELRGILAYCDSTPRERDYSFIASLPGQASSGSCIYCNHCQPCPAGIDIGSVSKYLDLARSGDELARDHYLRLGRHASDCLQCGSCEANCPFKVEIRSRLREARAFFGV